MASSAMLTGDSILRAYATLKAIRDNLPPKNVYQAGFYTMFDSALEELQQAGVDVSEWRLQTNVIGDTSANEFRARIDAILMYFTFQKEKTPIGFRK